VLAGGLEPFDFDVYGVGELAARVGGAGPDDLAEALVGSHLPAHPNFPVRHPAAAVPGERFGR
jgi:hypothetical protein